MQAQKKEIMKWGSKNKKRENIFFKKGGFLLMKVSVRYMVHTERRPLGGARGIRQCCGEEFI